MKSGAPSGSALASAFERRAARAEILAGKTPSVEEPLRFAAGLYRAQAAVAESLERTHADAPLTGRLDDDVDRFLDRVPELLRYAADAGPDGLAAAARARRDDLPATRRTRLLVYWAGGRDAREDYLSRAILRPYVETLRSFPVPPDRSHKQGRCPFCGGLPWVSARREGSTMEGARRLLACALCGGEWPFARILCPACGEDDPVKLPSFSAPEHPAVRLETCETCRRYVKSLDLSEDARPIPEVDDLVSLSLDLWAVREGLERIEPGLAGL
ncbi:MAG TPA: formate dehydrogenase accessory protein FdhE [Thermoanaerobaculia bacterium]|nr:formate dehydrogenase accessory protein FdhE [Thermoanaerobaculia bacterium]